MPLLLASNNGCLEIIRELLIAGADLNIANPQDRTPLFRASRNKTLETVKELLETYFPSLHDLSLRSTIKFKIVVLQFLTFYYNSN